MINTFRDRLMCDSFRRFRNLLNEINEFKEDLKKQNRRSKRPFGTYASYQAIKPIASVLNQIARWKRYGQQTAIDMFCDVLIKIQSLVGKLADFYDNTDLASTFQHLYNRLFVLLPEGTVIQHPLFDPRDYPSRSKKPPVTSGFLDWLNNYRLNGFIRRDRDRIRNRKSLVISQFGLSLRSEKELARQAN